MYLTLGSYPIRFRRKDLTSSPIGIYRYEKLYKDCRCGSANCNLHVLYENLSSLFRAMIIMRDTEHRAGKKLVYDMGADIVDLS